MEIIQLEPGQLKKAAAVVAAAFFNYPMFEFYFPDPKRRARYLPWYLGNVLKCALRYGEAYTTPDVSGVIFTLPPDHTRISTWEYVQNGFLGTPFAMGFQNYGRSDACETFVAETHLQIMAGRPHYYLWGLAVDPSRKEQGVGTALMTPFLAKADAERLPVYLETHVERNVEYYRRMGFTLARNDLIPRFNLPIWCMVREPAA